MTMLALVYCNSRDTDSYGRTQFISEWGSHCTHRRLLPVKDGRFAPPAPSSCSQLLQEAKVGMGESEQPSWVADAPALHMR